SDSIPELRRLWFEWDARAAEFDIAMKKATSGGSTVEDRRGNLYQLQLASARACIQYRKAEDAAWEAKQAYDLAPPEEGREAEERRAAEQAKARAEWLPDVLSPGSRASAEEKAMAEAVLDVQAFLAEKMKDPEYRRQKEEERKAMLEWMSTPPSAAEME